ncbi:hypothetical protein JCM5353_009042 [Sporobolomyces roseus]
MYPVMDYHGVELPSKVEIAEFFRCLVNLVVLDLTDACPEIVEGFAECQIQGTPLLHLRELSANHFTPSRPLSSFARLNLTHLTTLMISDYFQQEWNTSLEPTDTYEGCHDLPSLSSLEVHGQFAGSTDLAKFCQLCPSLTSLSLLHPSESFTAILSLLPTSLTSLSITDDGIEEDPDFCDRLLPRFTNLRTLDIDYHFSSHIALHLSSLTRLEELSITPMEVLGITDLEQLIDGPTRLPSLKILRFYTDERLSGLELEIDGEGEFEGNFDWDGEVEPEEFYLRLPRCYRDSRWSIEGLRRLITLAEMNGIRLEGGQRAISQILGVINDYELEVANYAIYQAWKTRNLKRLQIKHLAAATRSHSRFPSFDFDTLDSKNLKLVRTELIKEGCFELTLENGGGFEWRN